MSSKDMLSLMTKNMMATHEYMSKPVSNEGDTWAHENMST